MKKTRKILAVLLVAAMAMSFSITAFAAAGDLTKFTYDGDDYPIPAAGLGLADTDLTTTFDAIEESVTIVIPVSAAVLATIDGTNTFADVFVPDDGTLTYAKNPTGTDAISTIAGNAASITTLVYGDELWVADKTLNNNNVARILFSTPSGGDLGGSATTKNPIYNVNVATTLAFAIDPLQIDNPVLLGGQMSSGDFAFANASNVPVKVSVNLTAAGAGVLQENDWVPTDATSGAAKNVKLALLGAVSTTGTPTLADPTNGTLAYTQSATANTLRWFNTADKKASIEFLLSEGTGIALNTTAKNGVGIFQLYAMVETYADWAPGDITLSGTYKLQGFKSTDYVAPFAAGTGDDLATYGNTETAAYLAWNGGIPAKGETAVRADATELVGLNVFPTSGKQTALGFYGEQAFSRTQTKLLTVSKAAATSGYAISFNAGPLLEDEEGELTINPIESIMFNPTSNNLPFDLNEVTYDADAQTLNFPATGAYAPMSWLNGPAFFDVTLSEDAPDAGAVTYKILMEVTD